MHRSNAYVLVTRDNQYQHQTVLKSHVLDDKIKKDLCLEPRTINLQCQIIVLDLIQLHLCSASPLSLIILASMNMETEEPEVDDIKPQLDQGEPNPVTSQISVHQSFDRITSQSSVSQGALPECLKRCVLTKILNYRRKKSARARRTKYLPVFTSASARVSRLSHSHSESPSGLSQILKMTQLMFSRRHCGNKLKPKTSLHLKSLRHSAVKRDIIVRSLSPNVKSKTTSCISETESMYSIQTAFVFESFSSLTTA